MLAEARDQETVGHMQRTQSFVKILAGKLQIHKIILMLLESASSHDIGKISVPYYILKKSGKLSEEETLDILEAYYSNRDPFREIMQQYSVHLFD